LTAQEDQVEAAEVDALGIKGMLVINPKGRVLAALGLGDDPRLRAMISDPEWLAEARRKRTVPILLTDTQLIALISEVAGGDLVLLSEGPTDTVLNFVLNVDFAYDIIHHVLTDPYDAMAIVDAKEKVAFISPVHEKFFGLRAGEASGKSVRDVIENTRLHHVVRTGVAEVGQIHRMRGKDRVVSRHPIRHRGKIVGAIGRIMFKGPQQVETLARRINALEAEIAHYKMESRDNSDQDHFLDAIIGQSFAIQSVRQQIRKIAPLDIPVLIQGESGTGKELVAQALHMLSSRQDARLVTVNAAALPDSLVESELFGYEAGSFTGADRKGRAGKFELADKGTIFLDEIGDMPLEVQSKLLRVLQDRMVERVGGEQPKRVDFRLCSATNRDLELFVEQGKFRLDLYYRISPVTIMLPSLEERIEDVPLLVTHFVSELARQYGRQVPEVAMDVHEYLMERPWPGNIRQLRHLVERAFIFSDPTRLTVDDFMRDAPPPGAPAARRPAETAERPPSPTGSLKQSKDHLEAKLISDALVRFQGNKKKVAEHLGISRSYLYKRLESLE
jgi:transcriptional regulator with PAS, ATPase and Fis domain